MRKFILGIGATLMAVTAAASFAYQGVLSSIEGEPIVSKNVAIVFRLYDGENATQPLWARKINVRTDKEGAFNAELSDAQGVWVGDQTNALDNVLHEIASGEKPLYIGLTVDGSTGEILPRQKILGVPMASSAGDAFTSTEETFAIGGGLAVDGGVTCEGNAEFAKSVTIGGVATFENQVAVPTATVTASDAAVGACWDAPIGTIVLWWGGLDRSNTPPDGWAFCDGENGTPDLQGRFPLGAGGAYPLGAKGGNDLFTLEANHLPSHTHIYASDVNINDATPYSGEEKCAAVETYDHNKAYRSGSGNLYWWASGATGLSLAHENRPPFIVLDFIMRIK